MGRGERLEELAAIYADYQSWLLKGMIGPTPKARAGWPRSRLQDHPDLCRDVRLLIVDGFDEFNPTQLGVLKTLAQRASETILTLTGDVSRERPILRRFTRARDILTSLTRCHSVSLPTLHSSPLTLSTFSKPRSLIPCRAGRACRGRHRVRRSAKPPRRNPCGAALDQGARRARSHSTA